MQQAVVKRPPCPQTTCLEAPHKYIRKVLQRGILVYSCVTMLHTVYARQLGPYVLTTLTEIFDPIL